MRILILIALVLAVVWYLRRGRIGTKPRSDNKGARVNTPPSAKSDAQPQAMLQCSHCGVHLPSAEAFPGKGGFFCSSEHRAAYEHERRHEYSQGP